MDLNDSVEGFICPHCLVNFASSAKLQHHFLEFHSESGEQEDEEECGIYRRMDNHEEEVRNKQIMQARVLDKIVNNVRKVKRAPTFTERSLTKLYMK